jgi:hypothetical protein
MKNVEEKERHNINFSTAVWGELKQRSVLERTTASELVVYATEKFFEGGPKKIDFAGRYQPRGSDESRKARTVYFSPASWARAEEYANQNQISVSGLIEHLVKIYLGLIEAEVNDDSSAERNPGNIIQVGDQKVYLGENPTRINLLSKPDQK